MKVKVTITEEVVSVTGKVAADGSGTAELLRDARKIYQQKMKKKAPLKSTKKIKLKTEII